MFFILAVYVVLVFCNVFSSFSLCFVVSYLLHTFVQSSASRDARALGVVAAQGGVEGFAQVLNCCVADPPALFGQVAHEPGLPARKPPYILRTDDLGLGPI